MSELDSTDPRQGVQLYQERSGVQAEQYFEEIISGVQLELSEQDYETAKDFAESLFSGNYSADISCTSKNDLEKIYQSAPDNHTQTFYPGYFETEEGQAAIRSLGFDSFSSLAGEEIETVKSKTQTADRKKVAAASRKWYLRQLADQLAKPSQHDSDYIDKRPVDLNYEPEKLIEKIEDLQAFRAFYRRVRRHIKQQPESALRQAQETLLFAYRGRVNDIMARHYKDVISLVKQLDVMPNDGQLLGRIGAALPAVKATFLQEREDSVYDIEQLSGNFSRRLDFLRNGAAWSGSEDFTPISSELSEMAADVGSQKETVGQPELPEDTIKHFNEINWNSQRVKDFAEAVISEWGLLSAHQATWVEIEERDGPPDDGMWQVIITPKTENMSVDGAKHVFKIPEAYLRTTFNSYPAGAVPGVAHELMHLVQHEIAARLSDQVPLAKIKGRHTNTNMELGTINQERIIQSKVGKDRPVNVHYLMALSEKLHGGNRLQVARVFLNSYTQGQVLSEEAAAEARLLAADRTNRFYTHGGYNSASLAYLEQELLRRKLQGLSESDQQKILILGSVFDLPDLSRLTRAGLITFPEDLPYNVAEDVWKIFLRDYVQAIET